MRAMLLLLVAVGCQGAASEARKVEVEKEKDPVRAAVLAHLMRTLGDTDGFEVVEWGEQERTMIWGDGEKKYPAIETTLTYRSRTPAGGKRIQTERFYVANGKVVQPYAKILTEPKD